MGDIYKNPLRVYLVLGLLAIWGILAGLTLPVSLFPNSSKPTISANVDYGDLTADEFYKSYGRQAEAQMKSILVDGKAVDELTAEYRKSQAHYKVEFEWGATGEKALREVQTLFAALSASWPEDSRNGYNVRFWNENSGFLALSFYSPTRTLDELFDALTPLVTPIYANVPDAVDLGLFNPAQKNIEITLDPEKMASLQVYPGDVEAAVRSANSSLAGGSITVGQDKLSVQFPRLLKDLESS
jgi:multidrug efflux pump subunit AcrB